ncbi:MAG: HK97 family phage prohead protease [bacterium]
MRHETDPALASLLSAPWAIRYDRLPLVARSLARAVAADDGEAPGSEVDELEVESSGGVVVLPIRGTILQSFDQYEWGDGSATFLEPWLEVFRAAVADPEVRVIALNISSPGGVVWGVPEAAAEIRAATEVKPVIAVANAQADSAAYWLMTAASERYVTPSGEVGSVGVWSMHVDASKFFEEWGLRITLISEGEHKVEGNPFESLSDEAKEYIQEQTRSYYDMFVAAVAEYMDTSPEAVEEDFGQGRTVLAREAERRGMVDGIATLEEIVSRFASAAEAGAQAGMEDDGASGRSRDQEGVELRAVPVPDAEIRASPEGREVSGSLPFGSLSLDLGGFVERFAPGAFDESLEEDDQVVLWQHDPKYVMGRKSSGTARFSSDEGAMRYEADPPDAQWARDAAESIRRGDVKHSSFSFVVPEPKRDHERWERRGSELVRTVMKARLIEAGPQTFAAYQESEAKARASATATLEAARADGRIPEVSEAPSREIRRRRLRVAGVSD